MTPRQVRLAVVAVGVLLAGCLPHENVAMQGDSGGVIINYVGNVADTLPLARRHCAQYERLPVLHKTEDERAVYFCVKPGEVPLGSRS